jgi:ATP phosphoribosyltransferase
MSLLVESLQDRLLFAVPKKGRLYEKAIQLLAGADIKYNRAHRLDVALVQNYPIALYVSREMRRLVPRISLESTPQHVC